MRIDPFNLLRFMLHTSLEAGTVSLPDMLLLVDLEGAGVDVERYFWEPFWGLRAGVLKEEREKPRGGLDKGDAGVVE